MRKVILFSKATVKVFLAIIITAVLMLFAFFIAAPIINDNIAKKTANELVALPLPNNTEYIESVYKAGKLVGSGNGMQYFGAILIKSELSLKELKAYYSSIAKNEWDCMVEEQTISDIKVLEHASLSFKTDINEKNYYIVYAWGYSDTIFQELDIRGH